MKQRGKLSDGAVLLHDDARPRTAAHTFNTIQRLDWEVLKHPTDNPDLVPSSLHQFELRSALRARRFLNDDEVKGVVHDWLHHQLFFPGFRPLYRRFWKEGFYWKMMRRRSSFIRTQKGSEKLFELNGIRVNAIYGIVLFLLHIYRIRCSRSLYRAFSATGFIPVLLAFFLARFYVLWCHRSCAPWWSPI